MGDPRRNRRAIRLIERLSAKPAESLRWIEGYERLAEMAPQLPTTRLVYLADREADIMALMVRARDLGEPLDWLLRSKHNRTLSGGGKLWSRVTDGEPVGEIRFTLASRQGQRAREVVQLPDGQGGFVRATCIVAREVEPPAGDKPIEWRLLTNLPVDTLAAQLMFEPDEWKAAYILNKQKLPDQPPTLNEVVRLVARLGGFLARTGDGEPGVKTIWLGMQRILDFAAGIRFSRELLAQGTCV